MSASQSGRSAPVYRERLTVPWWTWLVLGTLVASLAVAVFAAVGPAWSGVVTVALGAPAVVMLWRSQALVEITGGELRAGRAHIPLMMLGRVAPLDPERAAYARGVGIDARAYHLIRGWVATAVLVEVTDPADPTPYWYVATRRPAELAGALRGARPTDRR